MPHSACLVCRLDPEMRQKVEAAYRRKVPVREIAGDLAAAGQSISSTTVHRHGRSCVQEDDLHVAYDPLVLAVVVRDVLWFRWPNIANQISTGWAEAGAHDAAAILQSAVIDTYKIALEAIEPESQAFQMMEARCLVDATKRLATGNPELASALAEQCRWLGGDDLADAFTEIGARPARPDNPAGAV